MKTLNKLKISVLLIFSLIVIGCTQVPVSVTTTNGTEDIVPNATEPLNQTNTTLPEGETIDEEINRKYDGLAIYAPNLNGESVLINYGENSMLINAGTETDSQNILHLVRSVGITSLDYFVLSDATIYTTGSLPFLILKTTPTNFIESGFINQANYNYDLAKTLFKNATKIPSDEIINFGDAYVKLLVPYDDGSGFGTTPWQNSIAVKVIYGGQTVLIMNGCDFLCEDKIMDDGVDADTLFISDDCQGNTLAFLQKVTPTKVISTGVMCDPLRERFKQLDIEVIDNTEKDVVVVLENGQTVKTQ